MGESTSPPTPDGVPLFGNGLAFSRNPVDAMETWASYGDLVELKIPGQTMYMVTGPSLIEQVLVAEHDSFTIGPAQRTAFAGAEDHAVTTNTGERWKRLRRALHPAFTRESIERYGDGMAATTAAYVDDWEDGEQFDLREEMRLLAVNVLGDTLLGVDVRGEEDVPMAAADALVDRANFRRPGQLLPDWVPTPTDRRFERAVRRLDEFVDRCIDEHRTATPDDDLLSVLLAARDSGDLTREEVKHNLVAMLLAGHESPAATLTYAWYLLSDRPAVLESLVAEHDAVVDGDRPGADAVDDLELTRNVVSETLRLYPPTTGINRQATAPVTLGGYEIPAGAQLLIPQWVPHRDERFWTDPTTFDPSRWDGESDRPAYAYFPFGGGPRNCIGTHFARQELTFALATMVGRLRLDVATDGPLTFTPSLQLRPETPMEATVRRR